VVLEVHKVFRERRVLRVLVHKVLREPQVLLDLDLGHKELKELKVLMAGELPPSN
jgi:hypothetical protein